MGLHLILIIALPAWALRNSASPVSFADTLGVAVIFQGGDKPPRGSDDNPRPQPPPDKPPHGSDDPPPPPPLEPPPQPDSDTSITWIFAMICLLASAYLALSYWERKSVASAQKQVEKAEAKVEEHPEKAAPAWELARKNLDLYFQRNHSQLRQVFVIAIIVMMAGFAVVFYGVYLALHDRAIVATLVAAVSGIITQFIGATFMVIYRSTMTQAKEFMTILERINSVGMAVQVLDQIPEENQLKNETRAKLVALLLAARPDLPPTK